VKAKLEPLATMFQYTTTGSDQHVAFNDKSSRIIPRFEATSDDDIFLYLDVQTTSWDFEGERTDLNDALSFFTAIFLRLFDISCALWDIPNAFSGIPTELYGRYITVAQPNRSNYRLDEHGVEQIKILLSAVRFFEERFGSLLEWEPALDRRVDSTYGWRDHATQTWARQVAKSTGETLRSHKIQYNFRKNPGWLYYRSIGHDISMFRSAQLAAGMRELITAASNVQTGQGVSGTAYVSGSCRNLVPHVLLRTAQSILERLEPSAPEPPLVLPIDTHFLTVGSDHLIALRSECGRKIFDEERERVRARRRVEDSVFFPGISFAWSPKVDDRRFELLIRDLLTIEPGVRWIRKVGETREGDEGRDLICEWITPPLSTEAVEDKKPPVAIRKVVVQCKASGKSVGKSKVQDVYDTVKYHECDGYFLAVSSQLSTTLTRFLESLRNKSQIWTDWWTRSEIEDRLRERPEILARYSDIVQVENG
jgi:hypothetical protein